MDRITAFRGVESDGEGKRVEIEESTKCSVRFCRRADEMVGVFGAKADAEGEVTIDTPLSSPTPANFRILSFFTELNSISPSSPGSEECLEYESNDNRLLISWVALFSPWKREVKEKEGEELAVGLAGWVLRVLLLGIDVDTDVVMEGPETPVPDGGKNESCECGILRISSFVGIGDGVSGASVSVFRPVL